MRSGDPPILPANIVTANLAWQAVADDVGSLSDCVFDCEVHYFPIVDIGSAQTIANFPLAFGLLSPLSTITPIA
jgi:hypothetical protein